MTTSTVSQRQALEVAVIRSMLAKLRLAGFYPASVYDGETSTMVSAQASGPVAADRVLTTVLNLDEARVYFNATEDHERVGSVVLVFGNDGWDVVSDWSWRETPAGEAFNAALDKVLDKVEDIGTAAACKAHTWAWELNDKSHHGACIKCGRSHGPGSVSHYFRQG